MVRLSVLSALAASSHLALGQASGTAQASSAVAPVASTSALPNTGANPLIPSSISSSCQAYLESLNGDVALATCTSSLLSALSSFVPSAGSTAFSATSAQISDSLQSLCAQPSCDSSVVRSQLNQFYGNCSTEMQAGNEVILGQFDVLYVLVPMTKAICTQDSASGWCLNDIATGKFPTASASSASSSIAPAAPNVTSSAVTAEAVVVTSASEAVSVAVPATSAVPAPVVASASIVGSVFAPAASVVANATHFVSNAAKSSNSSVFASAKANAYSVKSYVGLASSPQALFAYASSLTSSASRLLRRGLAPRASSSSSLTGVLPTAETWSASNLPFLFLSANMSSTLLCTDCTKSIMAPYIGWESTMPYPLGLSNSPLLGQQHVLWSGLGATCGTGFLSSITSKAGQVAVSSGAAGAWQKPVAALLAGAVAVFALIG